MPTIVVIEDHYPNARMADKLLTRAGYDVLVAEDGEIGLTTVFENEIDLILIDLGLPDIDGQTVIGLIRQHERLQTIPIIAFTAWPEDEAHDMAERYGCDGVITKPINTRLFASQITEFLAIATANQAATDENQAPTKIENSQDVSNDTPDTASLDSNKTNPVD
ncbi:MAG: response regulator [Phototrophicaceae bacterium]